MVLRTIDRASRHNTVPIERGHSIYHQFVLARERQCRIVDLQELNGFWVQRTLDEINRGLWSHRVRLKRKPAALTEDAPDGEKVDEPPRRNKNDNAGCLPE